MTPLKTKRNLHVFLAHLSHWLMVSYCDRWMSVISGVSSQLLQRTSPKLLAGRNDHCMAFYNIWSNGSKLPVHSISRSHTLEIDFQDDILLFYMPMTPGWDQKVKIFFF